jgi:hypothetical protein
MAGVGTQGTDRYATTTDIVEADAHAVFVMANGSWFGDWDHEDNFMRAFLATPSYGLACAWAGSPHWFLHHMGLGETIGFSTLLTQNNRWNGLYQNHTNLAAGEVHVALMGDPTLRMHPVAPISNLAGSTNTPAVVNLTWTASPDSVLGYHVYRSSNALGPFTRLSGSLINQTNFSDTTPSIGLNTYLVRAIKLETSASGSYYNPSQGIFLTLDVPPLPPPPPPTVTVVATDSNASHVGPDPATLLFTISRSLTNDLVVEYTLEGTATKLVDYSRVEGDMPESIPIPAGSNSVSLVIEPQSTTNIVETKTIILILKTNDNYLVGSPDRATISLAGNTVAGGITRLDATNVQLRWQTISNTYYHIAYKDDLTEPTWKDLGMEIQATNSITTWMEPMHDRRFYRILQSR